MRARKPKRGWKDDEAAANEAAAKLERAPESSSPDMTGEKPRAHVADEVRWKIWLDAFGNLLETLNRAFNEVQDTERGQYISGLTAVATFVGTFNKPIGTRFFELASKFEDLDKGH